MGSICCTSYSDSIDFTELKDLPVVSTKGINDEYSIWEAKNLPLKRTYIDAFKYALDNSS